MTGGDIVLSTNISKGKNKHSNSTSLHVWRQNTNTHADLP